MENSIQEIRSVCLYLLLEGDYGQVESLSRKGKDKFDAWELETYLAYAVFKTGQTQKALQILEDSAYAKNPDIKMLFREVRGIVRKQKLKIHDVHMGLGVLDILTKENEEILETFCELLCLEGHLKEAESLIRRMEPGHRKYNLEGLFFLQSFRFSFDQSRRFERHYDLKGSDHFLLSSRKHFTQSDNDYRNNIQAVMGMVMVSFYQKDFKTYSLKLSLLKNTIKNKKLKFSLSQNHPISASEDLPSCTGFKISLIECIYENESSSHGNVFNQKQKMKRFKDLLSNLGVYQTQNISFLSEIVCILSNHFQLIQDWQKKILKEEIASLTSGLFFGFNGDEVDFKDLSRLSENLMILLLQLGDLDNAKFTFQQVKELKPDRINDELSLLSIMVNILLGNVNDAESSLSLFEDTNKQNGFLYELFLSNRILLLCKTRQKNENDMHQLFGTMREYTSILRDKVLLSQKYPRCFETLSACHLSISSVIFAEIQKKFAKCFQSSVLCLLVSDLEFENFSPTSSFLNLFSQVFDKLTKLSEHFFGETELVLSLKTIDSLIRGKGSVQLPKEREQSSAEYEYMVNCQFFVRALYQGQIKDFVEYLSQKKSINLNLNNHLGFIFFEILANLIHQNHEKCAELISKVFQNLSKKDFEKDFRINTGILQILYLIQTTSLSPQNHNQTSLSPENLNTFDRFSHKLMPWGQLQILIESQRLIRNNKMDRALAFLLQPPKTSLADAFIICVLEKIGSFDDDYQVRSLVHLVQFGLDFDFVFRLLELICRQGLIRECCVIVEFVLNTWKNLTWGDFMQFLSETLDLGKHEINLSNVLNGQASFGKTNMSYFLHNDTICLLQLLQGRLLMKLGMVKRAFNFYQKMVASPNSSFFIFDFGLLLMSQNNYLEALNLMNLEFYFQKERNSTSYKVFEEIFQSESNTKIEFQITELQLIRHCLLNLKGELSGNHDSEDLLTKLESFKENNKSKNNQVFLLEIEMTNEFILKLSETKLGKTSSRNVFSSFVDLQSYLILGLKHCSAENSKRYAKLEKIVGKKSNPFALEDFVHVSPSMSSSSINKTICHQIEKSIQKETKLFLTPDNFLNIPSTFQVFNFMKNVNKERISKHNQRSSNPVLPAYAKSTSFNDSSSTIMGKLFLFLNSPLEKENTSNLKLISNLKQNSFRSRVINLKYHSSENLFRLRNIQNALEFQNFEKLKEESKSVLKSEYKPDAVWGLADALLLKKKCASSAEGFFKMLKKEQLSKKNNLHLSFSVGVFLLQGGLFKQCLNYLNLLLEPGRLQLVPKISVLSSKVDLSDSENIKNNVNTEFVYLKDNGQLISQKSNVNCQKSFYALYDDLVLKNKRNEHSQIAFILGLYFYKIKRLDPACKSFIKAMQCPFLRIPSLLHLLDISLHESSYNLYSNHFHKEKYSKVSQSGKQNIKFVIKELCLLDIPNLLKQSLQIVNDFVNIINTKEENKELIISTHEKLSQILTEAPNNSSAFCLSLYMQLILLLKTKQIQNSKTKLKEHLVKSKSLTFLPFFGQNTFYFRCLTLCVDILLSKDKTSTALQLINKSLSFDNENILLKEYLILIHKKGLKNKQMAMVTLEETVNKTQFSEPNLGYRLAQEYLAQGELTKAYHVSASVLKHYPNFNELKANVFGPAKKKLSLLI